MTTFVIYIQAQMQNEFLHNQIFDIYKLIDSNSKYLNIYYADINYKKD